MDRAAIVEFLAGLSDEEFAAIIAEARGADLDIKQLILRELSRPAEKVAP